MTHSEQARVEASVNVGVRGSSGCGAAISLMKIKRQAFGGLQRPSEAFRGLRRPSEASGGLQRSRWHQAKSKASRGDEQGAPARGARVRTLAAVLTLAV